MKATALATEARAEGHRTLQALAAAVFRVAVTQRGLEAFEIALEHIVDHAADRMHGQLMHISSVRCAQLDPFQPKKEIKIAAPDEMVAELVAVIGKHAHTGKRGDGIIWVLPIEESILI